MQGYNKKKILINIFLRLEETYKKEERSSNSEPFKKLINLVNNIKLDNDLYCYFKDFGNYSCSQIKKE